VECLLREVSELRALAVERGASEAEIASRLSAVGIHSKMSTNAAAALSPASNVPARVSPIAQPLRQGSTRNAAFVPPVLEQGFEWATRRFIMGTVVGALGVLADTLTEAYCDTSDFAKLFPGHSLWHIMMGWGLLNCMTYAAMLSRNTQAAQGLYLFERFPLEGPDSRMGGCLWTLRRLYFSFLPGFAFVPVADLQRLGVEHKQQQQQRSAPPLPAAPAPHSSLDGFEVERVPQSALAGKGPPVRARVQSMGD